MIHIDEDVFTYRPEDDMSAERFVLQGAAGSAAARDGLTQALDRFLAVDTEGVEHTDEASLTAAVDAGADNPSYTSDPEEVGGGLEAYVDCKGVIPDPMASTLRRILEEELARAGWSGRVSVAS